MQSIDCNKFNYFFDNKREITYYKAMYFENAYIKCFTVIVSTTKYACIGSGSNIDEAKSNCVMHAISIEKLLPALSMLITTIEKSLHYNKDTINKVICEILSGKYDKILV